ncbi:MAG: hypothetical protein A2020_12150 [Lentisphaerae bacterium GWF2_45_14]|nr:MAG: hypothetical protein A2020_12150 [Lentisphaerae bacterium GWF2_45_14]
MKNTRIIAGALIVIVIAMLLAGCMNKHIAQWKYDTQTMRIAEAYYLDDTSIKIWSEGTGKTIEISPTVVGM